MKRASSVVVSIEQIPHRQINQWWYRWLTSVHVEIMALEQELETYRCELTGLLEQEGKFVLIHQSEVAGVFKSFEDAMTVGYDKFGLAPFLVRKIQAVERPLFFHRDIFGPCPT